MNLKHIFFEAEQLTVLESIIRTSILYVVIFLSTKVVGFRQPSIMTSYNFLMAGGLGHIAGSRMVNPKSRVIDALAIILVYTIIYLAIFYFYLKVPKLVSQQSMLLVKDGKIIHKNRLKLKLTIDNLFSILREKDAPDLQNVKYLIAEATGEFSVMLYADVLPISRKDMGIEVYPDILSQIIIYNGKLDQHLLHKNGLDGGWLEDELTRQNIEDIKDISVGILTPTKELCVVE